MPEETQEIVEADSAPVPSTDLVTEPDPSLEGEDQATEVDLVSDSVKGLEGSISNLVAKIQADKAVPPMGLTAGRSFLQGFSTIAEDIRLLADDHVRRAQQTQAEAYSLAEEILRCGQIYSRRVEEESIRGYQVSRIVRTSRQMIQDA